MRQYLAVVVTVADALLNRLLFSSNWLLVVVLSVKNSIFALTI